MQPALSLSAPPILSHSGSSLSIGLYLQIEGVEAFRLAPVGVPAIRKATYRQHGADDDEASNHLADEFAAVAERRKLILNLLKRGGQAARANAAARGGICNGKRWSALCIGEERLGIAADDVLNLRPDRTRGPGLADSAHAIDAGRPALAKRLPCLQSPQKDHAAIEDEADERVIVIDAGERQERSLAKDAVNAALVQTESLKRTL